MHSSKSAPMIPGTPIGTMNARAQRTLSSALGETTPTINGQTQYVYRDSNGQQIPGPIPGMDARDAYPSMPANISSRGPAGSTLTPEMLRSMDDRYNMNAGAGVPLGTQRVPVEHLNSGPPGDFGGDHDKLLKAVTQNVANMLDQVSQQIFALADMRTNADNAMGQRMEKVQKDVLAGQQQHASQQHRELMELNTLCINTHGGNYSTIMRMLEDHQGKIDGILGNVHSLHGKHDDLHVKEARMNEVLHGMASGHAGLHDKNAKLGSTLDKALEVLGALQNGHGGLHSKVDSLDQRLASLERNGLETNGLLSKLVKGMPDGLDKQMRVVQEDVKRSCTAEMQEVRKEVAEMKTQLGAGIKKSLDSILGGHADVHKSLSGEIHGLVKRLDEGWNKPDLSRVKGWLDDQGAEIRAKLDAHSNNHYELSKLMDAMPDQERIMNGVHNLLGQHIGDHGAQMRSEINKLPLPPDERIMLQAIENMQQASLGSTLEAIEKLRRQSDFSTVKSWLDDHAKELHFKLDGHGKKHDNLAQLLDGVPDHASLMNGVHGLLADHMSDHSGKIMSSIDRLPLPTDEKVLLQAIENMQEAALGQTLEAIEKVKKQSDISLVKEWLDDHSNALHGKLNRHDQKYEDLANLMDGMPNHHALLNGVHGLLAEHMSDHSGRITSAIDKLPLPRDEKVMLQAIENMEESVLSETLEAIKKLKADLAGHTDALHSKFDDHGQRVDQLSKLMDGMPDHEALMNGVHGLLGEHLGDGHGKIMSEINNLDLDRGQKVMLQAIENMEESLLTTVLEAIQNIQMNVVVGAGSGAAEPPPSSKAPRRSLSKETPVKAEDKVVDSKPTRFDFSASAFSASGRSDRTASSTFQDSSPARSPQAGVGLSSSTSTSGLGLSSSARSQQLSLSGSTSASRLTRSAKDAGYSTATDTAPTFNCECGYSAASEVALSRHLARNSGPGHKQVP